jgi:hypothetical protein
MLMLFIWVNLKLHASYYYTNYSLVILRGVIAKKRATVIGTDHYALSRGLLVGGVEKDRFFNGAFKHSHWFQESLIQ